LIIQSISRKSFFLIITYIIFFSTSVQLFCFDKAQEAIEDALKLEEKNPQKAIEVLEEASELFPSNSQILFHLGRIYYRYSEILSLQQRDNSNTLEANLQNSDYYYQLAINNLSKALRIEPAQPDTSFLLGKICLRVRNYKDAIVHFEKYLELSPDDPEALFFLGVAHFSLSKFENAEQNFLKASELNPANGENYYNLGIIKLKQKRYQEGVNYLIKAANIFKRQQKRRQLVDALISAGLCAIKSGNPELGIGYYKSAISASPKNPAGYFNLAAYFVQEKYYDKALQLYSSYLNKDTDNKDVYERIISLLNITKKYEAGILILKRLYEKEPRHFLIVYYLAQLYELNEDLENAEEFFKKCIEITGEDSPLGVHIKKIIRQMKEKEQQKVKKDN